MGTTTSTKTSTKTDGLGPHSRAGLARLTPGIAAAALIMAISLPIADWLGARLLTMQGIDPAGASSPISAVLVAIVVGIIIRNTVALPDSWQPGINFSMKSILRLGIVFIGIKLSLVEIVRLGLWGIPIVVVSIGAGLVLVTWINNRMGLPSRLGTLIAAGTGVCGVTAIVSVAPAINADEKEVAYAVANITFFGLIGMFAYPYLAPLLFSTSEQVGLWLGIAVHETAQVVGAALTYREVFGDDVAFQVATVAKLTRNLFLIAVVPLLSFYYLRTERGEGGRGAPGGEAGATRIRLSQLLPMFVAGFVFMAVVRSIGDTTVANGMAFGLLNPHQWQATVRAIGDVWGAKYLLGTAMAAVGLGTHFSVFKGVGFKPFLVGLVGAVLVGLIGLVMVLALGQFVQL